MATDKKPTLVDLFCGCGGFSLGFSSDFTIKCAVENFKPVAKTYRFNFPEVTLFEQDIKTVNPQEILDICGGSVDVLIGSPPCEPFTGANAKREKNVLDRLYVNKIGRLTLTYISFLKTLKPKIFVMENVPQLIEGKLKTALEEEFKKAGYSICFNIIAAETCGNPSKRSRLFISNIKLKQPENKIIPVEKALSDLPSPSNPPIIPNHDIKRLSRDKQLKIEHTVQGKSAYHFRSGRRIMGNWFRLDPTKPAPTVMGNLRFIHPTHPRLLTVREQARLMSYPDRFEFKGGRESQYRMIGESVPPAVSSLIAAQVLSQL